MGAYFLQNGGAMTGVLNTQTLAIHDEERSLQNNPVFDFNYQNRGNHNSGELSPWRSRWPAGGFIDNGSGINTFFNSDPSLRLGQFEAWVYGDTGARKPQFIYGQVQNASGTPMASVNITAFITATNQPDGSCVSDSNGNYQCPCNTPGVAHYLVAYLPGSPDTAGVTSNTLVPTN